MFRIRRAMSFGACRRFVGASALALGCTEAKPESTSRWTSAIIGGEASGPEDDAIIYFSKRQPEPYGDASCTGTLIAPNVLVTALHCVALSDPLGKFSCRPDGTLAPPDLGSGWIGEPVEPTDIEVFFGATPARVPDAYGARVFGSGSTHACADDIAFVVLDRDLPSAGLPVRLERPVIEGEKVLLIGYGRTGVPSASGRFRRHDVPVLAVGPDDISQGTGTVAPRAFLVGDGPCDGDSGGPAISEETGAVIGVFSLGLAGECTEPGTRGLFTKLAPFGRLMQEAFTAAGREPRLEGDAEISPPGHADAGCTLGGGRSPARESRRGWAATAACLFWLLGLARRRT